MSHMPSKPASPVPETAATPLSKTQKRKQKKALKHERKNRAKMVAEKQGLQRESGLPVSPKLPKSPESPKPAESPESSEPSNPSPSSKQAEPIIATNEPNKPTDALNNTPSRSDNDSSDTGSLESATGSELELMNKDLSAIAKKIRDSQRKQYLLNVGVGIVETEKTSSFRRQQAKNKKRRQLTKKDKVEHNSVNPAANLILKHRDDSPALQEAAQRVERQQAARGTHNACYSANYLSAIQFGSFAPSPEQREGDIVTDEEASAMANVFATLRERFPRKESQREESDDMSARCVTIASDLDDEEGPEPATSTEDVDAQDFASGSDDEDALEPVTSSENEDTPNLASDSDEKDASKPAANSEDVEMTDYVSASDSEDTQEPIESGALGALFVIEDHIDGALPSEDAGTAEEVVTSDDASNAGGTLSDPQDYIDDNVASEDASTDEATIIQDNGSNASDSIIPDAAATSDDVGNFDDNATLGTNVALVELTISEAPSLADSIAEVVFTPVEDSFPTLPKEIPVTVIDSDFWPPAVEPSKTECDSWGVFKMLSLPNRAQYPPALSVERELALIATHVAPLMLLDLKQEDAKAAKDTKKAFYEWQLSSSDTVSTSTPTESKALVTAETPMVHTNPLVLRFKPSSVDEPKREVKSVTKNDNLTSISEGLELPSIHIGTSPISKPSELSKESSPRPFAGSNEQSSLSLVQKMFKARNTYLGITSLEDFLDVLDFNEDTGASSKAQICTAFITLSADEAEKLQGQLPIKFRTDLPGTHVQRRIKLGSITLSAFLRDIDFDTEDMTHVREVIRSFQNAAQYDVKPSSKLAAAFSLEASSAESNFTAPSMPSLGCGSRGPVLQDFFRAISFT